MRVDRTRPSFNQRPHGKLIWLWAVLCPFLVVAIANFIIFRIGTEALAIDARTNFNVERVLLLDALAATSFDPSEHLILSAMALPPFLLVAISSALLLHRKRKQSLRNVQLAWRLAISLSMLSWLTYFACKARFLYGDSAGWAAIGLLTAWQAIACIAIALICAASFWLDLSKRKSSSPDKLRDRLKQLLLRTFIATCSAALVVIPLSLLMPL